MCVCALYVFLLFKVRLRVRNEAFAKCHARLGLIFSGK